MIGDNDEDETSGSEQDSDGEEGEYDDELEDDDEQDEYKDLGEDEIDEKENDGSVKDEDSEDESDEEDDTSSKIEVKTSKKNTIPDVFPKTTQTEFVKIVQTICSLLDNSSLILTDDEIKRNLGNTGLSPEMAFRLFRDKSVNLPLKISRFNQAYESIQIGIHEYPTNMDLYTQDLDSEEPFYTERIFTKNFS